MINRRAVEAVDVLLRQLTGVEATFGGKVFVGSADFRQIPPVGPPGAELSVRISPFWTHFHVAPLAINARGRR